MSRSNPNKDCAVAEDARPSVIPAGTPDWITAELIEATIRVWQPYYEAVLTPEEAVTIESLHNSRSRWQQRGCGIVKNIT